jgi:hypothetical protein
MTVEESWITKPLNTSLKMRVSGYIIPQYAGEIEQALNMEDRNQVLLVARAVLGKGEKKSRYF